MIRIQIPYHLSVLAHVEREVLIEIDTPPTLGAALDALENKYPILCGTIRDHATRQRRPFLRYYACRQDWSHMPADTLLPEALISRKEPLMIIGAIAGG